MNEWESSGNRQTFSITWVTNNSKLGTGGDKITLENAVLVGSGNSKSEKKNPDHYQNFTRNIKALDSDRIIKIHVLLVTRFNGMGVIR